MITLHVAYLKHSHSPMVISEHENVRETYMEQSQVIMKNRLYAIKGMS